MNSLSSLPVLVILLSMFGTTIITTSIESSLLPFLHSLSPSHSLPTTLYIRLQSLFLFTPILLAFPLASLSTRFGERLLFSLAYFTVAIGLSSLFLVTTSRLVLLYLGYTLYAVNVAARVIRLSLVTKFVDESNRTRIMGLYQFMIPVAASIAPLILMAIQKSMHHHNHIKTIGVPWDWMHANFVVCICVACALAIFCLIGIPRSVQPSEESVTDVENVIHQTDTTTEPFENDDETKNDQDHEHDTSKNTLLSSSSSSSSSQSSSTNISFTNADIQSYLRSRTLLVTFLMCLMNTTYYLIQSSFQPFILSFRFATSVHLTRLYFILGIFSLFPPLLVAVLSTRISDDRIFVLFAVVAKLIASLCILQHTYEWPAVFAYILAAKGTIFFTASIISLYSKLLGRFCNAQRIAFVCSVANVVPAVLHVVAPNVVAHLVGTKYAWGVVALSVTACLVLGFTWHYLSVENEWATKILGAGIDTKDEEKLSQRR